MERKKLRHGEVEDPESDAMSAPADSTRVVRCAPVEGLPALLLIESLGNSVLLELRQPRFRVCVLPAEPVLAGLGVVLPVDVPAADMRQVVLEVQLGNM